MEQIVTISPEASAPAVRRLLAQVPGERIVLDLPPTWAELANLAQMRLLQRQAQIQGIEIALLSQHLPTHDAAHQVGVPVFSSQRVLARQPNWRMTSPFPQVDPANPAATLPEPPKWRTTNPARNPLTYATRPTRYKARQRRIQAEQHYVRPNPVWLRFAGYGVTGALFVVLLIFFTRFILPAATVTVRPGTQPLVATITLVANTGLDVADPGLGLVPARQLEARVEFAGSIPTSGQEQAASGKARGLVTFSNVGRSSVTIPRGTEVRTGTGDGVSFVTLQEAQLPGQVNARVDVPIEALELGARGNVRANSINTVAGPLAFQVRVLNASSTYGGTSDLVRVVKQVDKDNLLDQLYTQAENEALQHLQGELTTGEWLAPASVQTLNMASIYDHFNDEPTDVLQMTLRILYTGIAIDERSAVLLARQALLNAVPAGGQLVARSIGFSRPPTATVAGPEVTFVMQAQGNFVIPIEPTQVSAAIAGVPLDRVEAVLQEKWPLVAPAQIYRDPEWGDAMPALPGRIQVRVEYVDGVDN